MCLCICECLASFRNFHGFLLWHFCNFPVFTGLNGLIFYFSSSWSANAVINDAFVIDCPPGLGLGFEGFSDFFSQIIDMLMVNCFINLLLQVCHYSFFA